MKIYNVLINDRHCDPIIHNFTSVVAAINFARSNANKYNYGSIEEKGYNPETDDGWILFITTSYEHDYVRVSESELIE